MPPIDNPVEVSLPTNVEEAKNIIVQDICDFPQGHCFGSDGGTGIPEKDKVEPGSGGTKEVWTLSQDKLTVEKKENYLQCQYCKKYVFQEEIIEG